jgi:hypothetical protein
MIAVHNNTSAKNAPIAIIKYKFSTFIKVLL